MARPNRNNPTPTPNAETPIMDAGGPVSNGAAPIVDPVAPSAPVLSADALLFGLFGRGARSADREAARSALIAALSQETGETPDVVGARIPRDIGTLFTVLASGVAPSEGGSWAAGAKDGETRGAKAIAMLKGGATAEKAANAYADIGTPVQGAARYMAARLAHGRVAAVGDGAAREAGVKKVTSYAANPTRDV